MVKRMNKASIYGNADPRDLPAYPIAEVAHFLWMARSKVGRWAFGYEAGRRHQPVIQVADPAKRLLSFNNLAEVHVLSALRHYNVPLQRIRQGIRYLRDKVVGPNHPHPLLAHELQTDGLGIFIEHLGQLINITREGQGTLRELFEEHLRRIERDPNQGTALRLFPFVRPPDRPRDSGLPSVPQPWSVSIDPEVSFGRPVLAGTRVPTVELADRFSAGEPIESLSEDLGLDPQTIEEAIRYQLATRAA
jgi:uncharacterized protein (DUF433 family)